MFPDGIPETFNAFREKVFLLQKITKQHELNAEAKFDIGERLRSEILGGNEFFFELAGKMKSGTI